MGKKVLAVLRLIRLPLLFTALADALVLVVLTHHPPLALDALANVWLAAAGLYVFGMAGNDVMDARRDRQAMQAGRVGRVNPVASGELSRAAGAGIALAGAALALAVGYASACVNPWIVAAAVGLIALYNGGAKFLPPLGLLLLGLIRAANSAMALNGQAMLSWWAVPAIIGFHVIFVSAFAYAWEGKRPPLYGNNWFILLVLCSLSLLGLGLARQKLGAVLWPAGGNLWAVGAAWGAFAVLFLAIFTRVPRGRRGGLLVFSGLGWLIVLDWAFTYAAGQTQAGMLFAVLLACVLVSSRLLRWAGARTA